MHKLLNNSVTTENVQDFSFTYNKKMKTSSLILSLLIIIIITSSNYNCDSLRKIGSFCFQTLFPNHPLENLLKNNTRYFNLFYL